MGAILLNSSRELKEKAYDNVLKRFEVELKAKEEELESLELKRVETGFIKRAYLANNEEYKQETEKIENDTNREVELINEITKIKSRIKLFKDGLIQYVGN